MSNKSGNKFFRRLTLLWCICLISWTTYITFTKPPIITEFTFKSLAAVIGILTVVIGFYKWMRMKEDSKCSPEDKTDDSDSPKN